MIELRQAGLCFHPGTANEHWLMRNFSLRIQQGDFITVIGSNGAGKSCLFNLLAGHLRLTEGEIFFKNQNITHMPEYRRSRFIGRVFQNPLLGTAGRMSLVQNLLLSQKKGMKWPIFSLNKGLREQFARQMGQLQPGLEKRLDHSLDLFSGGQRQLITLQMMVNSKPELILLDEHTAALDPDNANRVLQFTHRLIEEQGFTAMMITHNMQQAIDYGNRLLMLDRGEIVVDLSGEEKKALRPSTLIERFRQFRHREYAEDRDLLS